jgi:hypothetical protein
MDRSFCVAVLFATTVPRNAQSTIFPVAEFPVRWPAAYESNPEDVLGQAEREDYREINTSHPDSRRQEQ